MAVSVVRHTGDGLCWRPRGLGAASQRLGARGYESRWVADGHWSRLRCQALRRIGRCAWRRLSGDSCCGWCRCSAALSLLCAFGGTASIGHLDGAVVRRHGAEPCGDRHLLRRPPAMAVGRPRRGRSTAWTGPSSPAMSRGHGQTTRGRPAPESVGLPAHGGSPIGVYASERHEMERAQSPVADDSAFCLQRRRRAYRRFSASPVGCGRASRTSTDHPLLRQRDCPGQTGSLNAPSLTSPARTGRQRGRPAAGRRPRTGQGR